MKVRHFFALAGIVLASGLSVAADDGVEVWIAKARSYLGTEAALNAVSSLHFEGSFAGTEQVPDPADPKKTTEREVKVGIDIVFQQPMEQRQILRSEKVERTTGLDGYDGWERVADPSGKAPARITLLDGSSIKRLRATTIENLSFYSNRIGGARKVTLQGEATVDDVPCVKLSFAHSESIVFNRYFEKSTGRLIKTEIEGGGEIREEGEVIVKGVRFPHKVLNKTSSGRVTVITFDKVTVNEAFSPETFAVPTFQLK